MSEAALDLAPAPPPRWFDRYNGNLLKPAERAQLLDMLAAKQPHAEIIRKLGVCEGVIKAVRDQDQETIEQRRAHLMAKAFRIADKAADRVEELIPTANASQASISFGIFSEKGLLFAGEATQRIEVNVTAPNILDALQSVTAQIAQACTQPSTVPAQSIDAEFTLVPDSTPAHPLGLETGSSPSPDPS